MGQKPTTSPRDPREGSATTAAERDRITLALAARQHNCISRRQLVEIGYSNGALTRRIRQQLFVRVAHGVYTVGADSARFTREFAAVLSMRQPAWVSHATGAAAWKLGGYGDRSRGPTAVHLSVESSGAASRPGVRVHRVSLRPGECATVAGLPVLSPTLILMQLAAMQEPGRLVERALADALDRKLTTRRKVEEILARRRGWPGAPLLRELLHAESGAQLSRSEAEARILELIRKSELPPPDANVRLLGGRYEADLLWRDQRAIVEVDSYRHHDRDRAFQADRTRDAVLGGEGWRVMRVTWRDITREPEPLLVRLTRFLYPG